MGGCCCCSSKGLEVNTSPPFYHYPRVGEEHEPLSSHNAVVSTGLLIVDTNLDTSIPDTYRPPPAPIQYDSNLFRPVRTESENVGDSNSITNEPATKDIKEDSNCKLQSDIELVEDELEKSGELKKPGEKILVPEEEDVCPTCLEEYDEENPKIVTKCEHHFHLSCILEWLERSDTCPVCDQEMIFNPTNDE
jgi:hypothetical protein